MSEQNSADIPKESPRTILFQFVVFPLGVVAIAVAIFFLFGKLASDEQTIPDYLNEVKSGGRRERWQAAYQLSQLINAGQAKKYPNLVDDIAKIYNDSKTDDPRIRQYLSMVLGNLGDRRATPLLVDALSDRSPETRIYAALALGRLRDPAAVPPLLKAFSSDERDVRKAAAYALGEIGDRRAVEPLAGALVDPIADVRYNASIALARFGDTRAIGVIREMLDRSRLDRVQGMRPEQKEQTMLAAIPALTKIAPEEAPKILGPLAQNDPSLQVRSAAKEALEKR
ncbi:MAG TPA: HEAT repeat domain-containing protein [Thermoanaerobaculia bacterium]|jgi:HEAT repeat protein|nr:HEAT repeat domain-containing protein [Thermoanaerobaculia bacterium]